MKPLEFVKKPWGNFRQFTLNELTTVKTLTIDIGQELSLQTHMSRSEYWYVLIGKPLITQGDTVFEAEPHQEIFIKQGQKHRIAAPKNQVVILEIAHGHFDENDIIRLEDKYNR
jgi:mannose-6-phosphate isomerase-like protein (cupin superfamily)